MLHSRTYQQVYYIEYIKENFGVIKIYKDVQHRFRDYCKKYGYKQYELISKLMTHFLDVLEKISTKGEK